MAEITTGVRTFDAVAGVGASSASVNLMQDQIAEALGPLEMSILANGLGVTASPGTWDTANVRWDVSTGKSVRFIIPVRAGQTITEVYLGLEHSGADVAGGSATIIGSPLTAGAGAPAGSPWTILADPWNTGGVGTAYNVENAALAIIPIVKNSYSIQITGQAGMNCYVWGVSFTAQFGN